MAEPSIQGATASSDSRDGRLAAVIGISHLSCTTGATVRAIRHYENVGLLSPIRSANGGRWFTPEQAAMAETIVLLRRMDVPIEEIRTILSPLRSQDRRKAVTAALEAKVVELEGRLRDARRILGATAEQAPEDGNAIPRVIDFKIRTRRAR